jgi:hypothetical protein
VPVVCSCLRRPHFKILLASLATVLVSACNSSSVKLYPVTGKVTYKDQPTDGASIVFQPVEGETPERPKAYGTVNADGSFKLRTEPHGEGAAAGDYHVLVVWYGSANGEAQEATSKLPVKYADPTKPLLKATVKEGPNDLGTFAIK